MTRKKLESEKIADELYRRGRAFKALPEDLACRWFVLLGTISGASFFLESGSADDPIGAKAEKFDEGDCLQPNETELDVHPVESVCA